MNENTLYKHLSLPNINIPSLPAKNKGTSFQIYRLFTITQLWLDLLRQRQNRKSKRYVIDGRRGEEQRRHSYRSFFLLYAIVTAFLFFFFFAPFPSIVPFVVNEFHQRSTATPVEERIMSRSVSDFFFAPEPETGKWIAFFPTCRERLFVFNYVEGCQVDRWVGNVRVGRGSVAQAVTRIVSGW